MRKHRPDVVIAYTQKPIIYGGIAARLTGRPQFHVLMSGLGYVFSAEADKRRLLRRFRSRLYRAGVRDRKSQRLNSSPYCATRMPSSPCKKKQHTVNTQT